ncbi:MAG: hypothetical protein ABIQ31_20920 [Ferruginibacter sp.]
MRDEQMDHMDELIREASNSHHAAYDDKAWEKMEVLLDEHLPLKKDKRRPAIFFILLLLVTGTLVFSILYQVKHKKENTSEKSKIAATSLHPKVITSQQQDPGKPAKVLTTYQDNLPPSLIKDGDTNTGSGFFKEPLSKKHLAATRATIRTSAPTPDEDINENDNTVGDNNESPEKSGKRPVDKTFLNNPSADILTNETANPGVKNPVKDSTAYLAAKDTSTKPAQAITKPPSKPAVKKGFTNNFAISLSAGPDLSFVNNSNAGKSRINYGVGVSYNVAQRITVRSGFYVAQKTYSAKGTDYHPPVGYWTYNTYLEKVDADCKVYEVPLSVSYNFKQSKNHSWFAGVGFSTFIMKRETYNYLYKNSWGQDMRKTWTLLNGNEQYFSVLTISGGYQYKLSRYVSILAEPYFKAPLRGIGFGKIKLNSGGVLFTASVKPFAKK